MLKPEFEPEIFGVAFYHLSYQHRSLNINITHSYMLLRLKLQQKTIHSVPASILDIFRLISKSHIKIFSNFEQHNFTA